METKPEIFAYLDIRDYLQAIYDWRKENERQFSYSAWAGELGFRSRSFLRFILVGKRSITENAIPHFVSSLKLRKSEAEYFSAMVKFSRAGTNDAREYFATELKRLHARNAPSKRTDVHDPYEFLASHLGPRLQVLLTIQDLVRTREELARLLGARPGEIGEMLERLERMGLARKTTDAAGRTQWEATSSNFEVKDRLGDVALQSFHRKSLEDAIRAIDEPVSERKYQSAIFPLSDGEYAEVQEEVRALLVSLLSKFKSSVGRDRRLYQMNVNLIPVTGAILRYGERRREPAGQTEHLLSKKEQ